LNSASDIVDDQKAMFFGVKEMEDVALRDSVNRLDNALRHLPFSPQVYRFSERQMSMTHPIDNEGGFDLDYLVVTFDSSLPPYWMHRTAFSRNHYLDTLKRQNVDAVLVEEWAYWIKLAKESTY